MSGHSKAGSLAHAISEVVNYLSDSEQRDYELASAAQKQQHIFRHVRTVQQWLARADLTGEFSPLVHGGNHMTNNNKPDYELRLGRVRVAVWKNTTKESRIWYNVSVTRTWKDEAGNWHEAFTFSGLTEVVLIQEALRQARNWIAENEGAVHGNT